MNSIPSRRCAVTRFCRRKLTPLRSTVKRQRLTMN
jgi:hypothetical protein